MFWFSARSGHISDGYCSQKDALLGYGYDKGEGLNRRWWVLESKIPPDISQTEVLEISKLFYEHGSVPMPFYHSASFEAFRSADDGEYIYFTMPNIVMYPYRGCAFTRINGGRVDKEVRDRFLRDVRVFCVYTTDAHIDAGLYLSGVWHGP